MKKQDVERLEMAIDMLKETTDLLTDRISDLHEVKLGQSERHSFCYYRSKIWDARNKLNKITIK